MSPIDYIILAIVAVCFVLAVYFSIKRRKSSCCGCCESCAKRGKCEDAEEKKDK